MRLSKKAFAAAAAFLKTQARPLEAALFAHHFEGAAAEPAIYALAAFQNADGGFGRGLEADIQLPDSSVIATATAFPHFRALRLGSDHPMVAAACEYLNGQYLAAEKRWRIMPENVDDAPHAPWWQVGGDLWHSRANPTAEILGFLYEYPHHFAAARRDELTTLLDDYLEANAGAPMEMHDLLCYVALVENPAVPEVVKERFVPSLKRAADHTVERSPEKWANYSLPPLAVINKPDSPLASVFAHELPENFAFMLNACGEDGAWHPNWSWADGALAKQVHSAWAGVMTLNNLIKLRAFDMIAL